MPLWWEVIGGGDVDCGEASEAMDLTPSSGRRCRPAAARFEERICSLRPSASTAIIGTSCASALQLFETGCTPAIPEPRGDPMSHKKSITDLVCMPPDNSCVTRRIDMKQYGRSTPASTRPSKRLVNLAEAAEYAACCRETIRRRIADGTLHGYRLGKRILRVDLNEIDEALREIPTATTRYPSR